MRTKIRHQNYRRLCPGRRRAAAHRFGLVLEHRGLSVQTSNVQHTYQVMQEVESITAVLKDAQAGTRGYLLTGDTVYLRPYSVATGPAAGEPGALEA